ncbi:MAG: hypothetical protein LBM61_05460 [Prevotellaceae bacterium]|jgi:hypothetical protein|nr:hypothetical protein [Prevotellaceae bacterium]
MRKILLFVILSVCLALPTLAGHYNGFKVSIYITQGDVSRMSNTKWLDSVWTNISSRLDVDKVYIETYRDGRFTPEAAVNAAKKFFKSKGVEYGGGVTFTKQGDGHWATFGYVDEADRAEVKKISEFTAKHFDEFILDDFFFNSDKSPANTAAKGTMSWTEFRVKLMNEAARDLVVGPAHAVNPKCKVIIKYPNWYEHFPALGFDLSEEAKTFDGIWTGTESRMPDNDQHLQTYLSYEIIRYFNNIAPGRNGGGWIDTGGMRYADLYAEQAWLTLWGKTPECILFEFGSVQRPVGNYWKGKWQGTGTSFNWDDMGANPTVGSLASVAFKTASKVLPHLGNPVGIKSYKPIGSVGDDNLQNFLGMAGLPIEMVPDFPEGEEMVLLTEQAACDPYIIDKIKKQLKSGNEVLLTSGFAKRMQKELGDIVELRVDDRKGFVNNFGRFGQSKEKMIIPQVLYYTNDAWEDIPAIDKGVFGWAFLLNARYENGMVWVLTVPDSYADIYELPAPVLNRVRTIAGADVDVRIEGPAKVSVFAYDNNTFIVESFLDEPVDVKVVVKGESKTLTDVLTGEKLTGTAERPQRIWLRDSKPESGYSMTIKPHSFRVFKY